MNKDSVKRSDDLDKRLVTEAPDLNKSVADLIKYGNRHLIRLTILSLIFDVALTLVLLFVVNQSIANKVKIASNQQLAVTTCVSGNTARAEETQLWGYVLSPSVTQPQTVAQQKRVTAFRAYVGKVFAPRDCKDPS